MHQTFLIENRGGAGGTIATAMLAHANPDGYTLMVQHMGLAFNAGLYDNLSFDTSRDVLPVANIGTTPNVLVVTNNLPVKSVGEFLAYAKKNPKRINYGSGGVGSAGHVSMEVLQAATGVQLTHVPYKGSGPAIIDLISGQIQAMLLTIPAVMSFIRRVRCARSRHRAARARRRCRICRRSPRPASRASRTRPGMACSRPAKRRSDGRQAARRGEQGAGHRPRSSAKLGQQGLEVRRDVARSSSPRIVSGDIVKWAQTIKKLGLRALTPGRPRRAAPEYRRRTLSLSN